MNHIDIYEHFNRQFVSLPSAEIKEIACNIKLESKKQNVFMFIDASGIKYIDIKLRPWFITKSQVRFFHSVCLGLRSALNKLFPLYFRNKKIRDIFPFSEEEKSWFGLFNKKGLSPNQPVIERLDSNVTFQEKTWKDFKFIESNSVGVGGIHYVPVINNIINKIVIPVVKKYLKGLEVSPTYDFRELLLDEMSSHARLIGRKRLNIALVEVLYDTEGGTDEFLGLKEYFDKKAVNTFVCDPRDLYLKRGEIYFKDNPIDVIYRDSEIYELIDIEKRGKSVEALKRAFLNNQILSSIAGELDHKSAFEVLTREDFSRYFTHWQRRLFKDYVLWTRLIFERNTTSPEGKRIDLINFIRRNKDRLVIKPNRAYGGKEVTIGIFTSRRQWEVLAEKTVKESLRYVVQELARIKKETFPIYERGKTMLSDSYVISGFAATKTGIAFLGRASCEPVVNVSRGGALIATLLLNTY
ncbi:MAG: circularly permuted type 2 ATP-grasp protein [Candidatus Omnitrophica bacterium]|nr:circularly permuted type 2 ATP-grasp protein [Candidatus Omnitrophota bacterium]